MELEFKCGKDLNNFNKKYVLNKETGCWDWIASKNQDGYGQFKLNSKMLKAHRVSYHNFKGPIPEGLQLDHLCSNRSCINPDHLEPVTQAVNNRRGDLAKLTQAQVDEIRLKYSTGNYSQTVLGEEYRVSRPLIGNIVRNEIWK